MTARKKKRGRIKGCIAVVLLAIGFPGGNMLWAGENGFEQGLAALRNGQYQRAVEAFTLAIESAPQDFEAYNNRGFARIYTGDYDGCHSRLV